MSGAGHITSQRRKSADDPRLAKAHRSHSRRQEPARSLSQRVPEGKSRAPPKFVESSSSEDLEAGSSQQWEEGVVNPADIIINLEDEEGVRIRSTASSSSTLIDSDSPPRELSAPHKKHQDLSQERFGDDDHNMMSLSALAAGPTPIPLSNFYDSSSYFGEHQDHYPPPPPQPSRHEHSQHLSQPTYPSPPKSRHGKSLTDLTGSNISLTSSQQYLSQSVMDFQHLHRYPDSMHQISETRRHDTRYRPRGHSQLQRMSSDSHLNKSYVPGLQKSVVHALSEVKEEVEQKKQQQRQQARVTRSSSHHHHHSTSSQHKTRHTASSQRSPHKTQLQQKHVQATRVKSSHNSISQEASKQRTPPLDKK